MMSKHTPGPWKQGHTLATSETARWTPEQFAASDAIEARMVFANFNLSDKGKGRYLVAEAKDADDARLIAAAPELLAAQTMGTELNTPDFLDWIAARLVNVYGESPNVDFVISLRSRAAAGRAAIAKAEGEHNE